MCDSFDDAVGEDHPGKMVEETQLLDDETKEKILGTNAMTFLGLDKEKYCAGHEEI